MLVFFNSSCTTDYQWPRETVHVQRSSTSLPECLTTSISYLYRRLGLPCVPACVRALAVIVDYSCDVGAS